MTMQKTLIEEKINKLLISEQYCSMIRNKYQELNNIPRTQWSSFILNKYWFRWVGLHDLIDENVKDDFIIAEIGSFEGVSTQLFSLFCKKVFSVDPYQPCNNLNHGLVKNAENIFYETILINYDNIFAIKNTSVEASKYFKNESLDMVYIDGIHDFENVLLDISVWAPKVKKNGIISGHDLSYKFPGTEKAVKTAFLNANIKLYADTSWAVIKSEDLVIKNFNAENSHINTKPLILSDNIILNKL